MTMTTSLRVLLLWLSVGLFHSHYYTAHAIQDANAPWGDRIPRQFQNYWREPGNLLQDVEQFSALYITTVGCLWSEYGYAAYDDDGENRDGDEQWYQGRTTAFRANAAYNLYGIRKGHWWSLRTCGRHSYINTFITNNGADTILNVTGRLKSSDDFYNGYGHSYCYEVDNDDNNRDLGSGDNNNNNNNNNDGMSTTMGCSLDGDNYAMAVFEGDYCDGKYFMDISDNMRDYNKQMRRVKCAKIWDYSSAFRNGERVDTPADYLLQESSSCSNSMYNGQCPDPYGVNKAYRRAVTKRGPIMLGQTFLKICSWMAFVVGIILLGGAYYAKHRRWLRKRHAQLWSSSPLKRKRKRKRGGNDEEEEDGDGTIPSLPSVELSKTASSPGRNEKDGKKKSKSRKSGSKSKSRSRDRPQIKEENTIV